MSTLVSNKLSFYHRLSTSPNKSQPQHIPHSIHRSDDLGGPDDDVGINAAGDDGAVQAPALVQRDPADDEEDHGGSVHRVLAGLLAC